MVRYRRSSPPEDFFGNLIQVGDEYFYGSPPCAGRVIFVGKTAIEISYKRQIYDDKLEQWIWGLDRMRCNSPEKGICLDKTRKI